MNLKVREAISSDYNDISKLNTEIHNLYVENRPDVFMNINLNQNMLKSRCCVMFIYCGGIVFYYEVRGGVYYSYHWALSRP